MLTVYPRRAANHTRLRANFAERSLFVTECGRAARQRLRGARRVGIKFLLV